MKHVLRVCNSVAFNGDDWIWCWLGAVNVVGCTQLSNVCHIDMKESAGVGDKSVGVVVCTGVNGSGVVVCCHGGFFFFF